MGDSSVGGTLLFLGMIYHLQLCLTSCIFVILKFARISLFWACPYAHKTIKTFLYIYIINKHVCVLFISGIQELSDREGISVFRSFLYF